MPDELSVPRYFLGEAATAADVDANTVKAWLQRKIILMKETDREAAGAGRGRLFSLRRVLQIAITGELVKLGISPSRAAEAAIHFTDIGAGPTGWLGDPEGPDTRKVRNPGELFRNAWTILMVAGERAHVARVTEDTKLLSLFNTGDAGLRFGGAVAAVNLNDLVDLVRTRLGLPRADVWN